jgi:hypothetical protein
VVDEHDGGLLGDPGHADSHIAGHDVVADPAGVIGGQLAGLECRQYVVGAGGVELGVARTGADGDQFHLTVSRIGNVLGIGPQHDAADLEPAPQGQAQVLGKVRVEGIDAAVLRAPGVADQI